MQQQPPFFSDYSDLLKRELKAALGCTEPIAIAYAAAKARETLGEDPTRIQVSCSANIFKNARAVVVPNAGGGLKGVETAALLGVVAGQPEKELEVVADVSDEQRERLRFLLEQKICSARLADQSESLYIAVDMSSENHRASVEIARQHTRITRISYDGRIIFRLTPESDASRAAIEQSANPDVSAALNLQDIITYADAVDLTPLEEMIDLQIQYNSEIAQEGLNKEYGARVGKTVFESQDQNDVLVRAKALAAAGSDARMSGCPLPVVINSGSGNQGLTVSLPVIEYARSLDAPHESLIRALLCANLIAIMQKQAIGSLSAYCGAVCAAVGAACGIGYLSGGRYPMLSDIITNTLATISGMVCDGAKPSCAAKIASSLDASFIAMEMARKGRKFAPGDGIIKSSVDKTIQAIGEIARDGMKETDREILKVMLENE